MIEIYTGIGKLVKKHGLNGDIIVRLEEGYEEDMVKTEKIFIENHGQKIPYFVESLKVAKVIMLRLEDIESPEATDQLMNKTIYLHSSDIKASQPKVSDHPMAFIIGMELFDVSSNQNIGLVEEIVSYPQQEMAIVRNNKKSILIPLVESFIVSIDEGAKVIKMELPEGLLSL